MMHKETSRADIAVSLGLPLDIASLHDNAEDEVLTSVDLMDDNVSDELDF